MVDVHDLDARTTAVYRAFLRQPDATPGDLAARVGTGEEEVCAALATLADRGFVRRDDGRLVPVRPDAVVEHRLTSEERDLERRRRALVDARVALAAEMDDYFAGREATASGADIETVTGLDTIRARIDDVLAATRHEMLAVITDTHDSADAVDAARDEDFAMLDRGVRIRTIYPRAVRDMPNTWAYAAETAARGEVIRLSDDIPTRIVIRDRNLAVIPMDPEDIDAGVQIIRAHAVVAMFVTLFELCWARATPAFEAQADVVGERGKQLLDLLANGAKDETIARHLGLNVRTVRRDIATLISAAGAETRFQAGVRAALRGWV